MTLSQSMPHVSLIATKPWNPCVTIMHLLEKVARACVRSEGTNFVWVVQFYGTDIAIKQYKLVVRMSPLRGKTAYAILQDF
jgi:hypothetical protein